MKAVVQAARLTHPTKSPVLEKQFLRLYSRWHETHNVFIQKKVFMSLQRLLDSAPGFDFRERLWQAA